MGRVAAPYGVRGWIKVKAFTEAPGALLDYPTWWLTARGGGATPHRVLEARIHSDYVIARLESLDSREQAAALKGAEVSVPRDQLPETEDDEVYWSDLAGCEVVNRDGKRLGKVTEVQGTAAHPMLLVASGEAVNATEDGTAGKRVERLIPFVPAFVLAVDLEAHRIDVDWEADY
jgi:16S rRNA processing protein RimM